jgi:CelD/BcsL family acetyltransferase involved in cellulose biosynthesis
MDIEVIRPSQLSGEDLTAWSTIREALGPDYANPFLGPEWSLAVERAMGPAGGGVQVAVVRAGGRACGFLPVRKGQVTAMPVGAPMCDYQAFVGEPGIVPDPRSLLAALGVQRFDFTHMLEADRVFGGSGGGRDVSYVVELNRGWDAYEQGRREAGTDVLKDIAKKTRKIERELGPVRFTAFSRSRADFETLVGWKREHYRRTRQTDPTRKPWVSALLDDLFAREDAALSGALFTLHIGDRLAAAHFDLRSGDQVHAWLIGHDDAFERHSPGLVMFGEMVRWIAESPFAALDLGPVAYRFKDRLATRTRGIVHGFVARPSAAGLSRAVQYGVRRAAERLPLGRISHWPGKAMRRLDLWRALA